ncbi:MAG: molybdopterin-dependent oxidoreductase [Candidatus Thorarchaeota archaeon]
MIKRSKIVPILKSYVALIIILGIFSTPVILLLYHENLMTTNITPNDEFTAINNLGIPNIDIATWRLNIDGNVSNPQTFSYENFTALPSISMVVSAQCVSVPLGTARFVGVPIRYIINMINPTYDAQEIVFYAADGFSSSLTISAALQYDVFIAWEMNGVPLPPEHGFPIRVVAPHHVGYKWVKFLDHIEIVNYDYKGYFESIGWPDEGLLSASIDWRYHSYLFAISFLIGGLSMISGMRSTRRGRIFRKLPKFISRKFHIFISMLFTLTMVLTFISWTQKTFIFRGTIFLTYHGILALLTMILVMLSYSSGIARVLLKSKSFSWHKNFSYLTILAFGLTLLAGSLFIFL